MSMRSDEIVQPIDIRQELKACLIGQGSMEIALNSDQQKIIDRLPENFLEEMYAHLMAVDVRNEHYGGLQEKTKGAVLRQIRGELFERLVCLHDFSEVTEHFSEQNLVEKELVALFHEPERFGIKGGGRNPDIALVDVETNKVVAVGEAKLGRLDERSFKQLEGYKKSMTNTLNSVNSVRQNLSPDGFLNRHGLVGISTVEGTLSVADDLKIVLILPSDKDIENIAGLIDAWDFRRKEDYEEYLSLLKSDRVLIMSASFSGSEVAEMSRIIFEKMDQAYNISSYL